MQIAPQIEGLNSMRTTEAAKECNVTLNTVRNWCKDYGAFLSPGATSTSGVREFSGRDLDVLKYIALLRAEGMQKGAIMQRLGETTFAEIDDTKPIVESPQNAPDRPESTPNAIETLYDVAFILGRLERLERARDPLLVIGIGIGFLAACFLFLLLIGLALLYGGFR